VGRVIDIQHETAKQTVRPRQIARKVTPKQIDLALLLFLASDGQAGSYGHGAAHLTGLTSSDGSVNADGLRH